MKRKQKRRSNPLLRRRKVALALIEGPHSIHPPQSVDLIGWLEPVLRLEVLRFAVEQRAVTVYCDDTMNRTSGFQKPVVRVASWARGADVGREMRWPLVDVRWGRIAGHRTAVDDLIRRLIREIRRACLVVEGLYDRRVDVTLPERHHETSYCVMIRTTHQEVSLRIPSLASNRLPPMIEAGMKLLESKLKPLRFRGWHECYDKDLTSLLRRGSTHWKWDGRPTAMRAR